MECYPKKTLQKDLHKKVYSLICSDKKPIKISNFEMYESYSTVLKQANKLHFLSGVMNGYFLSSMEIHKLYTEFSYISLIKQSN